MKKVMSIIIMLLAYYIIPLSMNLNLIIHPKVIILMISASILILTQPQLSIKDSKENKTTDKNSVLIIMISTLVVQVISIMEWAYFKILIPNNYSGLMTIIGFTMLVVGINFRVWSIKYLGKYFTAIVQVKDDHQLITEGPYSIVRHPSYLGAYVAIVGSAIFLNTIIGSLTAIVLMLYAYHKRITAEEFALASVFEKDYTIYQSYTKRMIPFVW